VRICSQAPTRICLIGGGTDVNPYAAIYQGALINVAVDLYHQVFLQQKKEKKIKVKALGEKREFRLKNNLVYGTDKKFDIIRAVINYFEDKISSGFELEIKSQIPDSSGLGTSGSVEVALIGCFKKWLGEKINRNKVAKLAFGLESKELGWHTGKQDQWAAAFGGLNLMIFGKGEKVKIKPIDLSEKRLLKFRKWLILVYTGGKRKSSDIQAHLKKGMTEKEKLEAFGKLKKITFEAVEPFKKGDFETLGKLFDIGWKTKKESNPLVTNKRLDRIYRLARENGVYGGKLIGAGGAGYYFFLCPPKEQKRVEKVLRKENCKLVDFNFDFKGLQTKFKK